jgi:WD40 repeat protein/tetratricopeptide (TPR) repeat protein
LLGEPERALFSRLAVFRGGCSAEAAEQVAGASLPVLTTLVDKSLLRESRHSNAAVEPRFHLLETIREYALEKLTVWGEVEAVQHTHAIYYLALAEAAMTQWDSPSADAAIEQLDHEHDNMRAALQWARDGGDATIGLQLAGVLWRFWRRRGYLSEGRVWLEELLALDHKTLDANSMAARLGALHGTAWLASYQHDFAHAARLFEESMALSRALGQTEGETHLLDNAARQARAVGNYRRATELTEDALARHRALGDRGSLSIGGLGFSLYELGLVLREQGDFARAAALFEECVELHREIGDREGMSIGLLGLGDVARDQGDAAGVQQYCEESLAILRRLGAQWAIGFALNNLALGAYLDGNLTRAMALISESVSLFRAQQADASLAEVLVTLGLILRAQGDVAAAHKALTEALRLARVVGPRLLVAAALEGLAGVMDQSGQADPAVRLLGAAAALRAQMGAPIRPADRLDVERVLATARSSLGPATFAAVWSEAREQPLEQLLSTLPSTPLLDSLPSYPQTVLPGEASAGAVQAATTGAQRVDWGDALAVPAFYGREWELNLLVGWVVEEHCRVVSVLGMGGIGKSALAVRLMHQLAGHFELVIWRSLRDVPTCDVLLDDLLEIVAPLVLGEPSLSLERRQSVLLDYMRSTRVLLVLDNLESVLEEGEGAGRLLPGYEGFGRFLRLSAETEHQSSVVLTSREKPGDLVPLEGSRAPVRALRLARLDADACEQLLAEKGATGTGAERARLIEAYAGNPLALKVVAQTIVDLFDGEIAPFLEQGEVIFGGIRELLKEQFDRLSAIEQCVLLWLAILREPAALDELLAVLVTPVPRARLLEAVEALRRRSLIERGQLRGSFTLQPVVLEYTTTRLIAAASAEIEQGRLVLLIEYGLELSHAPEYVRQTQERLIVAPILAHLRSARPQQALIEDTLLALLDQLRTQPHPAQGYGPANLVALLRLQRGDLRGLDLSGLALRSAYLQGVEMQDTTLSEVVIQGTVFTETFDAVTAVATSSTGDYWATGSRRGEVRLWTAGGLTLNRVWRAHGDIICGLTFSPDGRALASSGSWDGNVRLWDVASGALLWSAKHPSQAYYMAFAPDGRILASTGYDAVVRLWERHSGLQLQALVHPDPVCGVAWSPDGQLFATGDLKGCIRLWEVNKPEPAAGVQKLEAHTNCVEGLAFSPDGRTLASGSWDGTVKLWDVASGQLRQTLTEYTDRVICVAWSPDGRILASAGRDPIIWLWDADLGNYRAALQGHTGGVYGMAFTPDSRNLLSGSEDSTLRVWDMASARCIRFVQGYAASLYDVDWSPDGSRLVSGGSDALVTLYPVAGETTSRVLRGHQGFVIGVGWSSNGRWLASSEWNNAVRLWEVTSGDCFQVLHYPDEAGDYFDRLAWSPDGERLATGTYTHGIQLFKMEAQQPHWVGRHFPMWIRHVAWNPDGIQLAGGGADGAVYIWDTLEDMLFQRLVGHHSTITDVAWSPNGMLLASSSRDIEGGELFVWDANRGERLYALEGHPSIVYAVVWSSSEELLVSGDGDGTLRWWDIRQQECIRVREAHQGTIHSLRRSPDGSKLASCGDDGAIMLWDIHSGEYLQTLRRDRPYERLNITGIRGLTEAQKATLRNLGAIEDHPV